MTKKKKGIMIGGVAVAAAAILIVPGLLKGPSLPTVRTMTLVPTTLSNTVSVTGTVESGDTYQVYSSYSGMVDTVMVEVGDYVEAGDVLCQFDVEALELNIAQSEATLNQAQNAAYLQLRTAQKNLENAKKNLEDGLNSSIISADSAVTSAKIGKQNANLTLESAEDNADSIQDSISDYRDAYREAKNAESQASKAVEQYQQEYDALTAEYQNKLDGLQGEILSWQNKLKDMEAARETLAEKNDALSKSEAELDRLDAEIEKAEEGSDLRKQLEKQRDEEYIRYALAQEQQEQAQAAYDELKAEIDAVDPTEEINRLNEEYTEKLIEAGLSSVAAKSKLEAATEAYASASSAKSQAKSALDAARSSTDAADTAVEQAELGVKSAKNTYDTAVAQQAATYAAIEQQIESYEDAVTSAQIQSDTTAQQIGLQQLYKQLDDATVTAPISGTITAVYAQEGSPGQGLLFIIENVDDLEISTSIKEYDVNSVQEGMTTVIRTDAIDGASFQGTLSEIAPTASKNAAASGSVTFDAKVHVDEQDTGLRVGMNTRMEIVLESKENAFGVPYDAIHTAEDGSSFIIAVAEDEKGNMVTRYITVTEGMETDFYVEVLSDELTEGLRIVATSDLIPEGTVVQVA